MPQKNKVGSKEYKWSCCSLITKINSVKPEQWKWMWHLCTSCWPFPFYVCSSSSPLAESFQNIFHITRLIWAAQSSITNIVSDRPDAAEALSFPLQTDMRPDNSGIIVWQKTKKTKQTRRGQSTSYTSLNKHVMAERTPPLMAAPDTETSSFWAWCCCINSFITNHTPASCAQKYHLIITCTTDRSQVTMVLTVP